MFTIIQDDDPRLREPSRLIHPDEIVDLSGFAMEFMETAMQVGNCAGLAAPQVGRNIRMIAVLARGKPGYLMMNPVIESKRKFQISREGCLSVPKAKWGQPVMRAFSVRVRYMDAHGRDRYYTARGFEAAVLQHEIDHLNGVLFTDKIYKGGKSDA